MLCDCLQAGGGFTLTEYQLFSLFTYFSFAEISKLPHSQDSRLHIEIVAHRQPQEQPRSWRCFSIDDWLTFSRATGGRFNAYLKDCLK